MSTHEAIAIDSRFAEVNGTRLHYLIAGKGDPVLLLHGYAQTSHMWRPLIAELAKTHMVIAPDLRGFGDSAKPDGGYDKKTMAQDVHALATFARIQACRRRRARYRPDGRLCLCSAIPRRSGAHRIDGRLPPRRRRLDDRMAAAATCGISTSTARRHWRSSRAASASTSSISGTISRPILGQVGFRGGSSALCGGVRATGRHARRLRGVPRVRAGRQGLRRLSQDQAADADAGTHRRKGFRRIPDHPRPPAPRPPAPPRRGSPRSAAP